MYQKIQAHFSGPQPGGKPWNCPYRNFQKHV